MMMSDFIGYTVPLRRTQFCLTGRFLSFCTLCFHFDFGVELFGGRVHLKCDGTHAETRFRLSPKWTGPFKSAGASVHWTAGSRDVRIGVSNTGYTTF